MKKVQILSDPTSLIERSLSLILTKIEIAIQERDICTIVLAGGSTPKPLYEALATQNLPWEKIHIFWGDERYVSPEHQDSNQRMARLAWLDRVPIPASNIHPIPTDANNPAVDAQTYEQEIRQFFSSANEVPILDIILLGMGDDAHTASLFPQTEALKISDRLVTVGYKDDQPRITLTVPLINRARCVIFIVAGANKQPALAQVFAPVANDLIYPSRLIQPEGELWWLLDEAAGQKLTYDFVE